MLRLRRFTPQGFPIRTSPDQRLLGTSPKLIAATLRPSSPLSSQGIHHMLLFPVRKYFNHRSHRDHSQFERFVPLYEIKLGTR